jgi:hypothetical protein
MSLAKNQCISQSNLLDSSGNLAAIQALAGHANINTTAGYDRRGIHAQEEAAKINRLDHFIAAGFQRLYRKGIPGTPGFVAE